MVTGLEIQRYRFLNVNEAKGHARSASVFWPMLDGLPKGSLLVFSDLKDEREMWAMFLGRTVSQEDLRTHDCMSGINKADQLNMMHRIARLPTTSCRPMPAFLRVTTHPLGCGLDDTAGPYGQT